MSTFSGVINIYPGLSLDRFDGQNLNSSAYWLSHAHSDHMRGMDSLRLVDHLKKITNTWIYCTDITRKLLTCMPRYRHLTDYLVPLVIDEPTAVTIQSNGKELHVIFTAMAAGHCPGSAMLLIEGNPGTVLYTGDFRLDKGSAAHMLPLHDSGQLKKIDQLHCDTTFFTDKTQALPCRAECEEEILRLIKEHISRGSNYHVVLNLKAKLGYENIFRIIYDNLNIKTHIPVQNQFIYSKIPEILETLTDDCRTQVHACHQFVNSNSVLSEDAPTTQVYKCPTLSTHAVIKILHPSTLYFVATKEKQISVQTGSDTGMLVRCCYCFHSSYAEVEDFIRYLKPIQAFANVETMFNNEKSIQKILDELMAELTENLECEKVDSWKSIDCVDAWWIKKKSKAQDMLLDLVGMALKDKLSRNCAKFSIDRLESALDLTGEGGWLLQPNFLEDGHPSAKKPRSECNGNSDADSNGSCCSSRSRQSTPEIDLWSDEDVTDDGPDPSQEGNSSSDGDNSCIGSYVVIDSDAEVE